MNSDILRIIIEHTEFYKDFVSLSLTNSAFSVVLRDERWWKNITLTGDQKLYGYYTASLFVPVTHVVKISTNNPMFVKAMKEITEEGTCYRFKSLARQSYVIPFNVDWMVYTLTENYNPKYKCFLMRCVVNSTKHYGLWVALKGDRRSILENYASIFSQKGFTFYSPYMFLSTEMCDYVLTKCQTGTKYRIERCDFNAIARSKASNSVVLSIFRRKSARVRRRMKSVMYENGRPLSLRVVI